MNRHIRKPAIWALTLLLCMIIVVPAFASPTVTLNGQQLSFDVPPVIDNGRTLVPLRTIFEALGATVHWDDSTQNVTATKGNTNVQIKIGQSNAIKNGTMIALDVPAKIIDGRSMVPLRFVVEAFDGIVGFDSDKGVITIHCNQKQSATIQWSRCFPGNCEIIPAIVEEVSDGGYLVCGEKSPVAELVGPGYTDYCITLLKTNQLGVEEWQRVVTEGYNPEWFIENDDGYTIFDSASESQLIKTDLQGNLLSAVKVNGQVHFMILQDGLLMYDGSGLYKYDLSNKLEWEKDLPDSYIDSVLEIEDGFMVLGVKAADQTSTEVNLNETVRLWKLNSQGSIIWTKTYSDKQGGFPLKLIPCDDDGYLLSISDAGRLNTVACRAIRIDSNGSVKWETPLGGPGTESLENMVDTGDGYILAGTTDSFGAGGSDAYLAKLDYDGNLQWEKTIGSKYDEIGDSLCLTSDGGVVIAIRGENDGTSFDNIQLFKLYEYSGKDSNKYKLSHLLTRPNNTQKG